MVYVLKNYKFVVLSQKVIFMRVIVLNTTYTQFCDQAVHLGVLSKVLLNHTCPLGQQPPHNYSHLTTAATSQLQPP